MLKSFREQNAGSFEDISKEIDFVVDNWANELLGKMTSYPMDPSTKRSLWDRFKGTLSNLWYGGRYNPKNPYYWKHRFGDELGSTTNESFDPSIFTLQEYRELKSAIDAFEYNINEQAPPPGAEKLRIVQIIKAEAENLKKILKDLFAKKFQSEQPPVSTEPVPTGARVPGGTVKRGRGRPRKTPPPGVIPVSAETPMPPAPADYGVPDYEVGSEEKYKTWLPKDENKNKSLDELIKNRQAVDAILHSDYGVKNFYDSENDESKESAAKSVISNLEKLKNDALKYKEQSNVLDSIEKAIIKMKKFYE